MKNKESKVVLSLTVEELRSILSNIEKELDGDWENVYPVDDDTEHTLNFYDDGEISLYVSLKGTDVIRIEKE